MAFTQVLALLLWLRLYMVSSETLYVGYSSSVTYATASSNCQNECICGQLATWGCDAEYNYISTIGSSLGDTAWVGLDDMNSEGTWQFVDDDEDYCDITSSDGNCDALPQWNSGEPNDYGSGEDCAEMYTSGKLNDQSCSDGNYYICEYDLTEYSEIAGHAPIAEPITPPSDNVYIFEFTSATGMALLVSVVLNVVTISCICYLLVKSVATKSSAYSKVSMYATDDEKL